MCNVGPKCPFDLLKQRGKRYPQRVEGVLRYPGQPSALVNYPGAPGFEIKPRQGKRCTLLPEGKKIFHFFDELKIDFFIFSRRVTIFCTEVHFYMLFNILWQKISGGGVFDYFRGWQKLALSAFFRLFLALTTLLFNIAFRNFLCRYKGVFATFCDNFSSLLELLAGYLRLCTFFENTQKFSKVWLWRFTTFLVLCVDSWIKNCFPLDVLSFIWRKKLKKNCSSFCTVTVWKK